MQRISRAPELSATRSLVSCWIMEAHLPRLLQHFQEPPALGARERARLHHAHDVAFLRLVLLVMRPELAASPHDLLVGGVPAYDGDLHSDRLVGAGRDHRALAHLPRPGLARRRRRAGPGLAALGSARGPVSAAAGRGASPALEPLAGTLL